MTVKAILKNELNIKTQKSSTMINKCQATNICKIRKCLKKILFVAKTKFEFNTWIVNFRCENGHNVIKKITTTKNNIVINLKN